MKFSIYSLLVFTVFFFSSCEKGSSDSMTDAELIQAIQNANNKQGISAATLPSNATTTLVQDYTESYVDNAQLATELGYEVSLRRGVGSRMGERTEVYFNREGRELRRDRDRERPRGDGGSDREECFDLVFPVTFVLPDGSEVSGTATEIRLAIREWYAENPETTEAPELQFPVEVELENGTVVTMDSFTDLRIAYARCEERGGGERPFDCPRLRADIGAPCFHMDRSQGAVNSDCECE